MSVLPKSITRRVRPLYAVAGVAAASALVIPAMALGGSAKVNSTTFSLFPNPAQINCLSAGPGRIPTAQVTVTRGRLADNLSIKVTNVKPNTDFDLFTVQHSPQLANGQPDPAFTGSFGMAWYQSDLHVGRDGTGSAKIKTILLDQIFGFDASRGVAPVNTFNVGFWFNNPADAAACGFTGVTPFNGEHQAGPLAMISRLNATTNLGPLCTDPASASNGTFTCNP